MILGVTGHRPPDLGGYSEKAFRLLVMIAGQHLVKIQPEEVITGFALGWDQAVATACWELDIPYAAYIPFEEQPISWPKASRFRWASLRDHAARERVFGQKYELELMKERNHAIVDDSASLLANFNGYPYSGTGECLAYAKQRNKPFENVYPEWKVRATKAGIET